MISSEKLIENLLDQTHDNILQAIKFEALTEDNLHFRLKEESWTILECLEHLNLYGDFYIPEISKQIEKSKTKSEKYFKAGILGNYFAKMMQPIEFKKEIKTFKDKNPIGKQLDKSTITRFIKQQEQIILLLNASRNVDMNKIKTAISISKWINLKLGDTFKVVIYHNSRHILQANKILSND